jgi:hypothetical protein
MKKNILLASLLVIVFTQSVAQWSGSGTPTGVIDRQGKVKLNSANWDEHLEITRGGWGAIFKPDHTPGYRGLRLDLTGEGSNFYVSNGNFGVGTSNPLTPLHIRNESDGEDIYSGLRFKPAKSIAEATLPYDHYQRIMGFRRSGLWISGSSTGSTYNKSHILLKDEGITFATSDGYINPETNPKLHISNAGYVSVGTTAPAGLFTLNRKWDRPAELRSLFSIEQCECSAYWPEFGGPHGHQHTC